MLIVTADDYGKTSHATDSILRCFSEGRITSASAMVFMEDSERAARLALHSGMELGLHVNFTMPFAADLPSGVLRTRHNRLISYLSRNKMASVVYNPLIAGAFRSLFLAQQEEFVRLYGRQPDFYNGHHHMHLAANMLMGDIIPRGSRVRGTFTFDRGEKGLANRLFRRVVHGIVSRRFISPDSFFSILPIQDMERLKRIVNRAAYSKVEIEVHPENSEETAFLLGDPFLGLMKSVRTGTFAEIQKRSSDSRS